jgi:hypothetical protein
MPLTLRLTAFPPPAYADKLDYVVCEDGKVIGRIYEDWHTLPDLRWFWSITVYVDPKQGINTSGRAASLDRLKPNSYQTGRGAASTRLPRPGALLESALSLRPRTLPAGFIAPCLPTSAPHPPSGELWPHEIKHDGFRVIARNATRLPLPAWIPTTTL